MTPQYAKDQPHGFTNRIERVAIVGAGGSVGKHIVKSLLQTGKHTVTAVTRIGSKNELPEGVKVAQVDYENEQTLVDALRGQQFLFISLALTAPPGTQQTLISAASKAGIPWIVPNCYGTDLNNKQLAEENMTGKNVYAGIDAVEKEGISWIAMACSFWYDYSLTMSHISFGFDFANKKVTLYDDGKTLFNTSTLNLCGQAAAHLLSLKELPEDEYDKSLTISQWRNKPLYISSFLVSQRDVLESVHRVMGTTDADWTIEHEESDARYKRGLEMMKAGDRSGYIMAMYARTMFPNGDGNFEEKLANSALGLPKEKLDEATLESIELTESGLNPYHR